MQRSDIVIIGGGLAGLTAAYLLRNSGLSTVVLEAREHLGGRIRTLHTANTAPLEMGATWLGRQHTALLSIMNELEVGTFVQHLGNTAVYEPISTSPPQIVQLPVNDDPSYRVQGGTDQIITALVDRLDPTRISTSVEVSAIKAHASELQLTTNKGIFVADKVISTLPPALFASSIKTEPELPHQFHAVATTTHTWMSQSIKFALRYEHPFWQAKELSGTVFSNVGPIPEMYDHSNAEGTAHALMGFINGSYYTLTKQERQQMVMMQLEKYYGSQVQNFINYEEVVWANEKHTHCPYPTHVLPHQDNGHAVYQKAYLQDRLYFAGTETSPVYSGYMEGAVRSAIRVVEQVLDLPS